MGSMLGVVLLKSDVAMSLVALLHRYIIMLYMNDSRSMYLVIQALQKVHHPNASLKASPKYRSFPL